MEKGTIIGSFAIDRNQHRQFLEEQQDKLKVVHSRVRQETSTHTVEEQLLALQEDLVALHQKIEEALAIGPDAEQG